VPDDPPRTLAALAQLRKPGAAFAVRLNRFFWSGGESAIQHFLALTDRYTSNGYLVELQVRYHPAAGQEGNVAGFVSFVRDVVRRFGSNPRVVAIQVTNEVNFTISPDSSDGAFAGARDALIQGVIAAKDEARKDGYAQLTVGFNWFYRTDPSSENSFWSYLRDKGGAAFRAAVDWVGLDVYPGTFFPPVETLGGEGDGIVNALSTLRDCYLAQAQIPATIPIHVEENGWPTGPGRSETQQVDAMRSMIAAADAFRGTFNVSDYRWFDLRDHNTSSSNFQHHYGLLNDDYSPKPAFGVYRSLVAQLARPEALPAVGGVGTRPRLRLRVRHRSRRLRSGARCALAPLRASVVGADRGLVVRVSFRAAGRHARIDTRAPFARSLRPAARRRVRITARVHLRDGRRLTLRRTLRLCAG